MGPGSPAGRGTPPTPPRPPPPSPTPPPPPSAPAPAPRDRKPPAPAPAPPPPSPPPPAPSFGPVHARRERNGRVLRCRPRRAPRPCPHGTPLACGQRHGRDGPLLGEPMCPSCYDYTGTVLFNACAPELWRRFTITLRRALGRL